MGMIGTLDIEDAAHKAAGNWRHFDSFAWFRQRELQDPDQWAIIYTHHRDSGLIDQSNAAVIEKALEPFTEGADPHVVMESHHHWAVGHVDGFSVLVFHNGEITDAFRAYYDLAEQIDLYPLLDETDFSNREYEATLSNIEDATWRLKRRFHLPDDWVGQVYSWLSDNDPSEIESRDDQGGYPNEDALRAAFSALGFERIEE
jgi:hypothetical protein